jgi:sulfide:quinone oxidoreductase
MRAIAERDCGLADFRDRGHVQIKTQVQPDEHRVDYGGPAAQGADVALPGTRDSATVGIDLIEASETEPARVVVAGGGAAALEAVLALRAFAPTELEIELVAPDERFHARPLSVAAPFGLVEREPLGLHAFAADNATRFHHGAIAGVNPIERTVETVAGATIGYDALLLAIGASGRPILPGALTFRGGQDVAAFRDLLDAVDAGVVTSIAFAVPRRARWSLPLYELALMTAARASAHHANVRLEFLTHEDQPLGVFGPRVADRVRALLDAAGIRLQTSVDPIVAQPGHVFLSNGGTVAADRTVAVARLVVPPLHGVPQGPGGFIPTDPHGRVDGLRHVYAAGDATWFPIKQGGIATQQADSAASTIVADFGLSVVPEPFEPVLRGILLTGDEPEYLGPGPRWHALGKIAGRHLAPYLAGHAPDEPVAEDHETALELALEAADAAAGWKDPKDALRWLDVAEGLNVALPMEYADKRREWTRLTREAAL